MSGLAHPALYDFRKALRTRGACVEELAREVGITRHFLSRLLWGHYPKNKGNHWARIRACVTESEWGLLSELPHVAAWARRVQKETAPYCVRWVCVYCVTGLGFQAAGVKTAAGMTMAGICPVCFGMRNEEQIENQPKLKELGAIYPKGQNPNSNRIGAQTIAAHHFNKSNH